MSDLISRKAAIEAMEQRYCDIERIKKRPVTKGEQAIFLDMRGVVRSLPSWGCRMSDLIRRSDAIEAIESRQTEQWIESDVDYNSGLESALCEIKALPSAEPEQYGRVFNGIVVEYPSINTYPEYEGKPYFQIKYTENGQEFIGYGTYKPEVLSEFLKEYFMPSAEPKTGEWVKRQTIGDVSFAYCSECGEPILHGRTSPLWNFCPNCGVRMEVRKNDKR